MVATSPGSVQSFFPLAQQKVLTPGLTEAEYTGVNHVTDVHGRVVLQKILEIHPAIQVNISLAACN